MPPDAYLSTAGEHPTSTRLPDHSSDGCRRPCASIVLVIPYRSRENPFTAGVHAGLKGAFAIATLLDGSPLVYLDTLVEGEIGARTKDVHYAAAVWEAICARALSCDVPRLDP
ncbi:Scr1 family TA system antitoxin-like transcriptional regulator [Micromonospora sp. 050-3]|uniref:Scr1 family TA system antitoxin-like transcriptional regulator n=1 Tax=Micromonospora sp. 050-3 TaxID=2789265 RepID=UPI0039793A8F